MGSNDLCDAGMTDRFSPGVELDSLYIDVIVPRDEAVTGNPAVLIETGKAFELLAGQVKGNSARLGPEVEAASLERAAFGSRRPKGNGSDDNFLRKSRNQIKLAS
jgi:hypothetical protein